MCNVSFVTILYPPICQSLLKFELLYEKVSQRSLDNDSVCYTLLTFRPLVPSVVNYFKIFYTFLREELCVGVDFDQIFRVSYQVHN